MGIHADIYRTDGEGDCTNGGLSSTRIGPVPRARGVCLVNVDGPFEPTSHYPAAMLVEGNLPGTVKCVPAVPIVEVGIRGYVEQRTDGEKTIGPMMGGNYVATSDSRFHEKVRELGGGHHGAVPLHDRFETPADYDRLSS